jgi:hypothetical protein
MIEMYELKGSLKIELNGKVVLDKHNLVVNNGKAFGVSRLFSNAEFAVLSAIGLGAGTTAPAVTDTQLQSQLAVQAFDGPATRTSNSESATTTFGPGVGTGLVTEAGLFSGTGAGANMFSRSTFTGIPKGVGDTLAVTWTVTAP